MRACREDPTELDFARLCEVWVPHYCDETDDDNTATDDGFQMASKRKSGAELARLLEGLATPVFVLDSDRCIVFANAACRHWLGPNGDDIVGQECRYSSSAELTGPAALAAALSPPPQVYQNSRVTAQIVLPSDSPQAPPWQVEFIPLAAESWSTVHGPPFDKLRTTRSTTASAVIALVGTQGEPEHFPDELGPVGLHALLARFRQRLARAYEVGALVGESPAARQVRAQVSLAAAAASTVLVWGPPGSGRQHVARAIHYASPAATASTLVPLSCALLGPELLQSTIRTLVRPRLTNSNRPEATLLLTDAGQLPADAQAELAGLLSVADIPLRIISTAAEPLAQLAGRGEFRADLAHLLTTLSIRLVPLAERTADVPALAQHRLEQLNARGSKQLGGFTPEAFEQLALYHWPGELAELDEVVAQAHAQSEGPLVRLVDLPRRMHLAAEAQAHPKRAEQTIVLEHFLEQIEHELIDRALRRAKGNKAKAARLLGMTRPRLYRRMVQLGLEPIFKPEE